MKYLKLCIVLTIVLLSFVMGLYLQAEEDVSLLCTFFYSPHCKECFELKNELIPELENTFFGEIEFEFLNVDEDIELYMRLEALHTKYGKKKVMIPSILVGNILLSGNDEIVANLETSIRLNIEGAYAKEGNDVTTQDVHTFVKGISLLSIIGLGLLDGLNPCAFAIIIFFIGFLSFYGYSKKQTIVIGISYCVAVFITYLLIGLGLFNIIYALQNFYDWMKYFYYLMAGVCILLGILSIYDYFLIKKTNNTDTMVLQLPKTFKKRISKIIGSTFRENSRASLWILFLISIVIGVVVSFFETACTGQVYLPAIVYIIKNNGGLQLKAILLLLLYNLMFVMPLIAIFVVSLVGVTSVNLNKILVRYLGIIKLILGILFFAVALYFIL